MTIYGFDVNHENDPDVALLNFCYLHGKLEDDNGFDLCGAEICPAKDGVYSVDVILHGKTEPRKATFFFWRTPIGNGMMPHGLIVENGDDAFYNDAQIKFDLRAEHCSGFFRTISEGKEFWRK